MERHDLQALRREALRRKDALRRWRLGLSFEEKIRELEDTIEFADELKEGLARPEGGGGTPKDGRVG